MVFVACEKVIVGQEDNASTLMSILQGFDIPVEPPIDQIVNLPVPWYVFTLWERMPDDVPEADIQRIELFAPDQTRIFAAEVPIIGKTEAHIRFHRAVLRRGGFAIKGTKDHVLKLSIKRGDGAFEPVPNGTFPIPISIRVPEPAAR